MQMRKLEISYQTLADAVFDVDRNPDQPVSQNQLVFLVERRDKLVHRTERYMLFLVSILILIFLEINDIIRITTLFGLNLEAVSKEFIDGRTLFVFGFLLIGNLIALLHSGAMSKFFLLERLIERSIKEAYVGREQIISLVAMSFFPLVYNVLAGYTNSLKIKPGILAYIQYCHYATLIMAPLAYIIFYLVVLFQGLVMLTKSDSYFVSVGFVAILIVANLITLPLHAFTFFPRVKSGESNQFAQS